MTNECKKVGRPKNEVPTVPAFIRFPAAILARVDAIAADEFEPRNVILFRLIAKSLDEAADA